MSHRTIGRVVGALILLAYLVYLAGGAMVDSAAGTPAALNQVAQNETQIGIGGLLMLANSAVVITIGVLVFPIIRTGSETAARGYLVTRVVEGIIMAVGVLFLLLLIPLARAGTDPAALPVLTTIAGVLQQGNLYAMHAAMVGLGIGSVLFCLVLLRGRLIPRPLALLGLVGYPVLAAGELLWILGYDLRMLHYAPGGVFEVVLGVLLLVKGFPSASAEALRAAELVRTVAT